MKKRQQYLSLYYSYMDLADSDPKKEDPIL
jgi:hypothetical protein